MVQKKRIYILDILRGVSVLAMIIHHAYVLLHFTKGFTLSFFSSDLFNVLQLFFVCVFLLVSGICTNFSRNIAKRGLIVFGGAIAVTLVTAVLLPLFGIYGLEIYFGILHMFGLSMLLYALLKPLLDKCNGIVIAVICAVLFIVQLLLMEQVPFFESPYNITMVFGFPSRNFFSADYYPLFPYIFAFIFGAMLGRPIVKEKLPLWFYKVRCLPLEFVGRHSLLIYLLHQPIIMVFIIVFDLIF